jgi:tyrosyl-DNA phosphodiesterase 2
MRARGQGKQSGSGRDTGSWAAPALPARRLQPRGFDATVGGFRARAAASQSELSPTTPPRSAPDAPASFSLATWNIWFGEYCFDERLRALLDELAGRSPDVICLQEVTTRALERILGEPWVRDGYVTSDAAGETFDDYGVLMLSRLPIVAMSLHELPSHMGRRLLIADLTVADRAFVVATAHLDSKKTGSEQRAEQLASMLPLLRARGDEVLLVGDMNIAPTSPENAAFDADFIDLWPLLRPRDEGCTVDTDANPMLLNIKQASKRVRYDRALLRSTGGALRPTTIELLGTQPISPRSPDVLPSDHFGLLLTAELAAAVRSSTLVP